MSVYLFTALFHLLLVLLMCGTLCGHMCAGSASPSSPESNTFELFKKEGKIKDVLKPDGQNVNKASEINVKEYYSPFLMATKDVMIAMAGANYTETSTEKSIGILTRYIKIGNGWGEKAVKSLENNWITQLAVQNKEQSGGDTFIMRSLLAIAKENKIYVLLVNYTEKKLSPQSPVWEFKVAVGNVDIKKVTDQTIVWGGSALPVVANLATNFKEKLNGGKLADYHFSGSAFLTKEKIVFVLVVNKDEKKMFVFLDLKDDKTTLEFKNEEIDKDHYPYFFPWKEKIIMVPVNCKQEANKKIMEISKIGDEWKKNEDTLFQRYEFFQDKTNFTTVKINGTNVLLFTEEKTKDEGKKEIYLWISDGNHSTKVGTIPMGDGELFELLLYTNKELLYLHQPVKSSETKSVLRRFPMIVENITTVLTAWETNDKNIKNLCTTTPTTKTPCFTDGLVGFLSNDFGNDYWKDEYYYVNATLRGGTTTSSGLTFKQKGAGAMWPVGKSKEEQPYNFTDEGFTLVATVKIGQNDKEHDNSLLGILVDNKPHIRLWCRKDGKWGVSNKNKNEKKVVAAGKNCEQGKTYDVAFVLTKEKNILLYINWQQIGDLPNDINMQASYNITHFYFGVDIITETNSDVASYSTITNVMLYNRPFKNNEITELKSKQDNEEGIQQRDKNNGISQQQNKGGTTENDERTISTKNEKDAQSSPPPTTEDSAARVGVVGVLCFMLFGVFTLLGRYVY